MVLAGWAVVEGQHERRVCVGMVRRLEERRSLAPPSSNNGVSAPLGFLPRSNSGIKISLTGSRKLIFGTGNPKINISSHFVPFRKNSLFVLLIASSRFMLAIYIGQEQ